mmetsp:Transcript_34663/g.45591  ORF Transcript_34663/g.45591 Transcript_34663/m.45591 type:complete len:85 (+) Transcript_34663:40-294(+)
MVEGKPRAPWSALQFFSQPSMLAMAAPAESATRQPYKSKNKPCCVCKMTKNLRDQCIRNVDEPEQCVDFIEAHKVCLRAKGFRA